MMRCSVVLIFLFSFFFACEGDVKHEYERFAKQISPSGKFVIYDYSRPGSMAFSSDISGLRVLKIDMPFREGKGEKIDGAICEWINDDTLLVYNFEADIKQPKDTFPIKTDFKRIGDFTVKTVYYKANSGGRGIYAFDSVSTSHDSIFIRTVSRKGVLEVLSFPLGGTTIRVRGDSIEHIAVDTRLTKDMNFVFKNPDGTFTGDLPGIGTIDYELTPTQKIWPYGLNTRKIFWDLEN